MILQQKQSSSGFIDLKKRMELKMREKLI